MYTYKQVLTPKVFVESDRYLVAKVVDSFVGAGLLFLCMPAMLLEDLTQFPVASRLSIWLARVVVVSTVLGWAKNGVVGRILGRGKKTEGKMMEEM